MARPEKIAWRAKISSWLLFATAALAPLPFGSDEPIAIAFWCLVLGVALMLVPLGSLSPGRLALAGLAALVAAAYGLVLHEQLAEHPWLAAPHPIWREAQAALGEQLTPSASIVHNQPWFELGRPLVCLLAIACGFAVGANARDARRLMKVIAWSGAAYATYGILAHLFDPTHILWRQKEAYFDSVTGPFINRNTAGAYFGSCALVWSLLLWEQVRLEMGPGPLDWRGMPARLFSTARKQVTLNFAMLFLCLVAMFMTLSRGAVVLSLFLLVAAFTIFFRRHLPRSAALAAALLGCGAVVLVLLPLMGGGVNARFDIQGLASGGRLETYRATLSMIADHPWFGTGQGTFAWSFPAYRSPDATMWGVWDIAHNTLLEIAADMGLPIAALVVGAWITIFVVLVWGTRVRRRDRVLSVAALVVGLLAVLHSLIDFSLQIPGYAIVALSLVGAGLAQSFPSGRRTNAAAVPDAVGVPSG